MLKIKKKRRKNNGSKFKGQTFLNTDGFHT